MKLATWNVNSLSVRLPHLGEWLKTHPVDVIALQETKLTDDKFPHAQTEALGYRALAFGQKTYNGVALLSREPMSDEVRNIPGFDDPQARVLAASVAGLRVVGAYFPNGQAPGTDKFAYKMQWLHALHDWLRDELVRHPRLVLMGDFNIAPEDRDVHDPAQWEGSVHVSAPERAALAKIASLGLSDLFRRFEQPPKTYSWWDYRMGAFRRNHGLRIDLMLASPALAARCTACTIDRSTRALERPSDHAPVTAAFDIG